jgi:hypothetical protein
VTIGAPLMPEGREWRHIVRLRDRVQREIASHASAVGSDV